LSDYVLSSDSCRCDLDQPKTGHSLTPLAGSDSRWNGDHGAILLAHSTVVKATASTAGTI
jgi:hypothetical protein